MSGLRRLVLARTLPAGARLPSSRDLAAQLRLSRNTVVGAYERLAAEGYIAVKGRTGAFVTSALPETGLWIDPDAARSLDPIGRRRQQLQPLRGRSPCLYQSPRERVPLDFRVGRPAPGAFPTKAWTRLLVQKMAGSARQLTEYGDPAGLLELRAAIGDHLRLSRGIVAHPDQIIIVAGCEEGLNVVARILTPPGAPVYVEDPCYRGAAYVFAGHGAAVVSVPVDGQGLVVDALSDRQPGLVYVTPSHQFPTGATLPLHRRLALLDWAESSGGYIVEDDYDGDFRYDGSPLTALAGLDRSGSVIYVGTFSKSIGAGLRIGYLVVPEALIGPVQEVKALLNNGNPWLAQAVLAEFISSGQFRRHLRRIRRTYLARRDSLLEQLRRRFGDVQVAGEEGGMHLSWTLPDALPTARTLQYRALQRGVGVYSIQDGPAIALERRPALERMVLFGYPCLEEAEIVAAVSRLAEAAD